MRTRPFTIVERHAPFRVAVEYPDDSVVPVQLVRGGRNECGCRTWVGFGPPDVLVPRDANLVVDPWVDGHEVEIALRYDQFGNIRFAARPSGYPPAMLAPDQGTN